MTRLLRCAALFAVLSIAALGAAVPALAADSSLVGSLTLQMAASDEEKAARPDSGPLQDRALWSVFGIAVGCAIGGVLYVLRKNLGHFENPTWVAPISVMRSKDSPESYGDAPAGAHGHH